MDWHVFYLCIQPYVSRDQITGFSRLNRVTHVIDQMLLWRLCVPYRVFFYPLHPSSCNPRTIHSMNDCTLGPYRHLVTGKGRRGVRSWRIRVRKKEVTHRCSSIHGLGGTRSPERRVWTAGTSLRTWGAHSDSLGGCIPSAWSLSCGGCRWCSRHSWPWKGCSAPCAPEEDGPRSADSRCPGSRWWPPPLCIHHARIWGNKHKQLSWDLQKCRSSHNDRPEIENVTSFNSKEKLLVAPVTQSADIFPVVCDRMGLFEGDLMLRAKLTGMTKWKWTSRDWQEFRERKPLH